MVMDCSNGRMAENTMESGLGGNNMGSVFTEITRERKEKGNGLMVKECNGLVELIIVFNRWFESDTLIGVFSQSRISYYKI